MEFYRDVIKDGAKLVGRHVGRRNAEHLGASTKPLHYCRRHQHWQSHPVKSIDIHKFSYFRQLVVSSSIRSLTPLLDSNPCLMTLIKLPGTITTEQVGR